MDNDDAGFVKKYCVRFGAIAVKKGYINEDNLLEALTLQVEENLSNEEHRLIGTIFYDCGHVSEGFYVVDNSWRSKGSLNCWKRRLHSRPPFFALQGF